jgi:hypothetical protein
VYISNSAPDPDLFVTRSGTPVEYNFSHRPGICASAPTCSVLLVVLASMPTSAISDRVSILRLRITILSSRLQGRADRLRDPGDDLAAIVAFVQVDTISGDVTAVPPFIQILAHTVGSLADPPVLPGDLNCSGVWWSCGVARCGFPRRR